ncbi:hypothetical protein HXX76_000074 [Chlamydomonas incerta]|uniref:non-specific serine/threonine protein kinase n=1 Tax=Chlamydomonas incerta TaxID=51695 RepID=A0A835WE15_CHLIN|nr:hypothetical protein HXX76_000074 [Chlamydomonas incerta]|eukprot:KAG2445455.1 hypothetical protein HXX76_000074 [Chlamydomonas incerta]
MPAVRDRTTTEKGGRSTVLQRLGLVLAVPASRHAEDSAEEDTAAAAASQELIDAQDSAPPAGARRHEDSTRTPPRPVETTDSLHEAQAAESTQSAEHDGNGNEIDAQHPDLAAVACGSSTPQTPALLLPLAAGSPWAMIGASAAITNDSACGGWGGSSSRYSYSSSGWDGYSHDAVPSDVACGGGGAGCGWLEWFGGRAASATAPASPHAPHSDGGSSWAALPPPPALHSMDCGCGSGAGAGASLAGREIAAKAALSPPFAATGASTGDGGAASVGSGCGGRRLCVLERLMLEGAERSGSGAAARHQHHHHQQQQQQGLPPVESYEESGGMEDGEEEGAGGPIAQPPMPPGPASGTHRPLLLRSGGMQQAPPAAAAAVPPAAPLAFDMLHAAEWVARLGTDNKIAATAAAGNGGIGGGIDGIIGGGGGGAVAAAAAGIFRPPLAPGGTGGDATGDGNEVPLCVVDLVRLHLPAAAAAAAAAVMTSSPKAPHHQAPPRVAALLAARKTLLGRDVGAEALFEEEAMALQAVSGCPFVVPYLGAAVCFDRLQLFTQWAPGGVAAELDAALARCPQEPSAPRLLLPAQRLRVIGASALHALAALHAAEPPIAHLDVRPSNMLLLPQPQQPHQQQHGGGGGGGRVVLGGFGSAVRLLDSFDLEEEDGDICAMDLDADVGFEDDGSVDSFDLLGRPAARYVDVGVRGMSYSRVGAGGAASTAGAAQFHTAASSAGCCSCCSCCGCSCGCGAHGCGAHAGCPRQLPEAPCYLAPELLPWAPPAATATAAATAAAAAGQVLVTAKADIYSVGVLLAVAAVWHGCPAAVVARWQRGGAALPACVPLPLRHLIGLCTSADPTLRPSAQEALDHPFFAGLAMDDLL